MTRIALFGTTGTAGQGILREALRDAGITSIISIGRRPSGKEDPKLRDFVLKDPSDLSSVSGELKSVDACLYCLGVSALGMTEADYTAITKNMTLKVIDSMLLENPKMRFLYLSGNGADATARAMWARVKGETENELFARSAYGTVVFRPGLIQPLHGIQGQQSLLYTMTYAVAPLLRAMGLPVTTTEILGRAMLAVAKNGSPQKVLENSDISKLAAGA